MQKQIHIQRLTTLLEQLDPNLLQRATDYINGLVDGASEHDWWDDLPASAKEDYYEGMKDIEAGRLIPIEEVLKK